MGELKGYRIPRTGSHWRHFKGHEYIVKGLTMHSETQEYMVLYEDEEGASWVRPLTMWEEWIERPEYEGPRFTEVVTEHHGATKSIFGKSSNRIKGLQSRRKI